MELRESQKFAKGTGELQLTQSSAAERANAANGLSVPESNDGDVRASRHSERSARKSELSSVEDVASFAENQPTMDQDALMGHYKAAKAMGSYVSAAHGNTAIASYVSGIHDESEAMLGKEQSIIEEAIVENSSFVDAGGNAAARVNYG